MMPSATQTNPSSSPPSTLQTRELSGKKNCKIKLEVEEGGKREFSKYSQSRNFQDRAHSLA